MLVNLSVNQMVINLLNNATICKKFTLQNVINYEIRICLMF